MTRVPAMASIPGSRRRIRPVWEERRAIRDSPDESEVVVRRGKQR
jgi:hypothetical protein